jgi:glycosyltransferase involved in cell wall biosynthesis
MISLPFVSVIIPVFNDLDQLQRCLMALDQQTYPQSHYEVIVVDNGSTEGNVAETTAAFGQAIATFEPQTGSYAARNHGLELAKGDVIAFTDADCIPAVDWVEQGVRRLQQTPNCGLVAGRIMIFCQHPDCPTLVELYEQVTAFPQTEFLEKYQGGATANLFTFRSVFDRVGKFNVSLKSGGDLEWGRRVHSLGYQQIYAEDVAISHPARSSFQQLYKKTKRVAGGVYDLYVKPDYSVLQKVKTLLRLTWDDLAITLNSIATLFNETKLSKGSQKIGVGAVILGVGIVSVLEKTRLQLGGTSSRG